MIQKSGTKLRFGPFDLNTRTCELQKNGHKIKLQEQPARLLLHLASHPGELVTREDIQNVLWPNGLVVEFEHAINTDIKKIREALQDDPKEPRFVETMPKRGYRFIAQVEEVYDKDIAYGIATMADSQTGAGSEAELRSAATVRLTENQLPASFPENDYEKPFIISLPVPRARALFLFIQCGYLSMYCAALYYWESLGRALDEAGIDPVEVTLPVVIVTAMCGIAVRIYLLTEVGWAHPAAGRQFRRLFPLLLVFDALWAASPLLASRKIGFGLALAGVAGLAYLPFAQRTLMVSICPNAFAKIGR
jgi:DNA-binding winged helix-turn-helix (wHTH) protein